MLIAIVSSTVENEKLTETLQLEPRSFRKKIVVFKLKDTNVIAHFYEHVTVSKCFRHYEALSPIMSGDLQNSQRLIYKNLSKFLVVRRSCGSGYIWGVAIDE